MMREGLSFGKPGDRSFNMSGCVAAGVREGLCMEESIRLLRPFQPDGGVDLECCCEGLTLIAEAAACPSRPDEPYGRMVGAVAAATGCDQVHLHLISDEGDRLVRSAYHAHSLGAPQWSDQMGLDVGRLRWMISTGLPLVTDFRNPEREDRIPEAAIKMGVETAVTLPLFAEGEFVGACTVVYFEGIIWDDARLGYLIHVARVVSAAVKRVQSTRKASELLLLDERKRLGVEIHNSMASILASLSLMASSAMASCDEGDEAAMRATLERLELRVGQAIRALRDEALSLRVPFTGEEDLAGAFAQLVEGFRRNWGIDVEFLVEPVGEGLAVPADVSLQLVRILNECFSNIIHHAKASCVRVILVRGESLVTLTVEDDGGGFDIDSVPASCMGIRVMQERAKAVGGSLSVISDDDGTAVLVDVPC